MGHRTTLIVIAGLLPAVLHGQPRPNRLSFEVTSVKVVPIADPSIDEETPERVWYRFRLPLLVMRAYGIKYYQLENVQLLNGSPLSRYEIQATLPPGAKKTDIPAMLRSLLEDRFGFSAHWEERSRQVYKLEVDPSGLKLERLGLGEPPPDRPVRNWAVRQGLIKFRGVATMADLVEFLSPGMQHPVLDRTGAPGLFHISLDARLPEQDIDLSGVPLLARKSAGGPDDPGGPKDLSVHVPGLNGDAPDIGVALKKVGLRLQKGNANIKMLVVDSVNKTPTKN